MKKRRIVSCYDCGLDYGDGGFPDLIIPNWAWREISPTKNTGGLLCPSCICRALHKKKISCEGAFMSGKIESVSQPTMHALRMAENNKEVLEKHGISL